MTTVTWLIVRFLTADASQLAFTLFFVLKLAIRCPPIHSPIDLLQRQLVSMRWFSDLEPGIFHRLWWDAGYGMDAIYKVEHWCVIGLHPSHPGLFKLVSHYFIQPVVYCLFALIGMSPPFSSF